MSRHTTTEIRQFITGEIERANASPVADVVEKFGISRQCASRHLALMIKEGLIVASGTTRDRRYALVYSVNKEFKYDVSPSLQEHEAWLRDISPYVKFVDENVYDILQYGFSELFNNIIDHSESCVAIVRLKINPYIIVIELFDLGIGIFEKISNKLGLVDRREAVLELCKGKFTTDPDNHTGEGIFFSSKMFDCFCISSTNLFFCYDSIDYWLLENKESRESGTMVSMSISPYSKRTTKEIFDAYTSGDDLDFSKTHVPLRLAQYGHEKLISRSQAKRVLARFDKFKEIILDFADVATIGQGFADQIFRVYKNEHPDVIICPVNTSDEVMAMIKRVSMKDG